MNTDKLDLFNDKSEILKALAHPIRLCIVQGLIEKEGRNVTTMQSCLNAPQSTVSQHLSKLKAAGIIEGRRNGTEINYYVINEDAKKIVTSIL
ncbi:helix-turn-helix transcriptional regulator [Clostridium sp. D2Q-14]|uniref:ArsR/SmtB family transcription factor n=1 Tax=Anaeromonas gelatinilytica TaxID=2683194 RepID=UPI00193C11EA|nr:metalloregulator ArsR/SmtB family transcription factor [Anaeromonas gelatinilytica]MBS4534137.1 helix-turn-helix transcriptional regulator [Anaeromonas gelatinilytica]